MIRVERVANAPQVVKLRLARTLLGKPFYSTAAYWVDGLLVDTGCAHTAPQFIATLKGWHVDQLVNTHSHEDHIGANARVQELFGCQILAHRDALPILQDPKLQSLQPYRRLFWGWPKPSHGVPIDEWVETENHRFQVIDTPGHSPDHVCLFEPDRGWLFSGDAYIGGQDRALRQGYDIHGIIASLKKLGIPMTEFTVVIGAAGLAIGFALQGSLANFAAGVILIIFKPFKVGDFVELAGQKGTVREIQIFNTILNSPDNVRLIIPNGQVTGSSIKNYTVNGTRRVDLVVGVSYDDDLKKARQVIEQVLAGDDRILSEPPVTVAVSELADSSVNFVVRPWVKTTDYWDVYFNLTEGIKLALDKNGITIPYPQRDIHMKGGVS